MNDPVYDKYIEIMRACIASYGAQNTIHALSEAFRLESEDMPDTWIVKKNTETL